MHMMLACTIVVDVINVNMQAGGVGKERLHLHTPPDARHILEPSQAHCLSGWNASGKVATGLGVRYPRQPVAQHSSVVGEIGLIFRTTIRT